MQVQRTCMSVTLYGMRRRSRYAAVICGRHVALAGLFIAASACAAYLGGVGWVWVGALGTSLLVGVLWPAAAVRAVRVTVAAEARRVGEGDLIGLSVETVNRLPLPVVGLELLVSGHVLPLGPVGVGRRHRRVEVPAGRRGPFPAGDVVVRSAFPFGLWTASASCVTSRAVAVRPCLYPIGPAPQFDGRQAEAGRRVRVASSGEPVGLRDYRRGDSPRQIHRAATARVGRLIAHERGEPAGEVLHVALDEASFRDGTVGPDGGYEHAIRALGSLVWGWSRDGAAVVAHVGGRRHRVASPADADRFLDTLAALDERPSGRPLTTLGPADAGVLLTADVAPPARRSLWRVVRFDPGPFEAADVAPAEPGAIVRSRGQLLERLARLGDAREGRRGGRA